MSQSIELKMKTIVLSILVSTCVCLVQEEAKKPVCPENEQWNSCRSNCPPICNKPQLICTKECRGGACECVKGYIRSECGKCIPIKDCKCRECPENEHFQCCVSNCLPVCGIKTRICSRLINCSVGQCACDEGYIRAQGGQCIQIQDCHQCYPNVTASQI